MKYSWFVFCGSFRCMENWISYTFPYSHSFLDSFPIHVSTEHWLELPVLLRLGLTDMHYAVCVSFVWLFAALQTVAHKAPWNFPGKNTRADSHFLLQGICSTGMEFKSISSPAWQTDSLAPNHLGSFHIYFTMYQIGEYILNVLTMTKKW